VCVMVTHTSVQGSGGWEVRISRSGSMLQAAVVIPMVVPTTIYIEIYITFGKENDG